MLDLDPWINKYDDNDDDENDQITKEAYCKYENYLLSVRDKYQRILEKEDLLYQYPAFFENYQKTIEMIDGLWLDRG